MNWKGSTLTETTRLAPGDKAPTFSLPDADGKKVSLADTRAAVSLCISNPAASTPGCTKQACDFRDNLHELNDAGLDVIGISPDKPEKLAKFRDAEGLTFPLLSDPDRTVLTAYGAYGEKAAVTARRSRGVDPAPLRGRRQRQDRRRAVQRQGHRPTSLSFAATRRLGIRRRIRTPVVGIGANASYVLLTTASDAEEHAIEVTNTTLEADRPGRCWRRRTR